MRLAYVSVATPFRRRSWSGIPWYSHRELLRRFPDTYVIETPSLDSIVNRIGGLERHGMAVRRRPVVVHAYSRLIDRQLERLQPDAVVVVAAAHKVAYIQPKWPLIYAADAMYDTVIGYYDKYASISAPARARGNAVQRALLDRADRVLLSSDWAVQSAKQSYNLPDFRCRVVPMGANLDEDPGFQPVPESGPIRLLFVGMDWRRKGGETVLAVWKALRDRTGTAELDIVGVTPPEAAGVEGITVHGLIDKTDRAAYARFVELYRRSSFFFMPSRQEAYGIVYCEAAAFGRPVIAARTGGVPTIVRDGETGILIEPGSAPDAYVDRIMAVWEQPDRYRRMCMAARHEYETRLNWAAWTGAVAESIESVLDGPPTASLPARLCPA